MTKQNINKSSGLPYRNPTHVEEAENAEDQADIVKAIKNTGVKQMVVTYDYKNMDKQSPPPLAGITKIKEMTPEEAIEYCKSLLRSKPNIFRIDIKLGDYPSQKRISNSKTNLLNSSRPRFHTELGEKLGEIITDKTMLVTQIIYKVNSVEAGQYSAQAEVYGTNIEEYENEELFGPIIQFEFIKTS